MNDDPLSSALAENLQRCRAEISAAARRAGRDPQAVRILAVTKYAAPEVVRALPGAGLRDLGESRVQQLVARAGQFGSAALEPSAPRWHMIGHLQRNKVKALLGASRVLHSLDSLRLARELETEAARLGASVDVFVELNLAGEAAKSGAPVSDAAPLAAFAADAKHLNLIGLMTMAPRAAPGEAARPYFARLRELRDQWQRAGVIPRGCDQLSMGMSGDYAVAVEEGATWVRLGSSLFENLPPKPAAAPRSAADTP